MPSDRHTAYPPCTGTNDRNFFSHRRIHPNPIPLGTRPNPNKQQRKIPNTASTGRSIMRIHGSSQTAITHLHTSEHSKFSDNSGATLATTWVRQPIAKNPGRFSCLHIKTNTRVQTHQNLFTLTKNISLLNNKAGSKHPAFRFADLCRNNKPKNRNSIFPVNKPANRRPKKSGGDGRNRTDDPLLAKQVLYQLSYIPKTQGP